MRRYCEESGLAQAEGCGSDMFTFPRKVRLACRCKTKVFYSPVVVHTSQLCSIHHVSLGICIRYKVSGPKPPCTAPADTLRVDLNTDMSAPYKDLHRHHK